MTVQVQSGSKAMVAGSSARPDRTDRPVRVLHIAKTAAPLTYGGLESTVRQICLGLRDTGIAFDIVCAGDPDADGSPREADYGRVYVFASRVRISTCPIPSGFAAFLRAAAREYDVFHFHAVWPFAEMVDLFRRVDGPRRIVTYHADVLGREPLNALYRPLLRRFLASCDTVVTTSDAYARSSPVLSRLPRRPQVIPLGLDPASYPQGQPSLQAAWRGRAGTGFFLFLGMLRPYKGLEVLLRAAEGLGARVVIAGDGPMKSDLEGMAAQRGLDNVAFVGRVSEQDKVALLHLCRAVVLPSTTRAEAFGIALLEGQMFARALVSTELGTATSEVNQDGVTGRVVPPGNAGALRSAMRELLDDGCAHAFGAAARQRFDRHYRAEHVLRQYADLYTGQGATTWAADADGTVGPSGGGS